MNKIDFPKKLIELGDVEGAERELRKLLQVDRNDVRAWLLLAKISNDEDARKYCLQQVFLLDPQNPDFKEIEFLQPKRQQESAFHKYGNPLYDWLDHGHNFIFSIGSIAIIILLVVIIIIISVQQKKTSLAIPTITPSIVSGSAKRFIPEVSELPDGFVVQNDMTGPLSFSSGDAYQASFTNPDFLFVGREVNVFFNSLILDSSLNPEEVYHSLMTMQLEPDAYSTSELEMISAKKIAALSNKSLIFGTEIDPTTKLTTINYTLTFRYNNYIGSVIVSGPIDDLDSGYNSKVQSRLLETVYYYTSLVVRKLPISKQDQVILVAPEFSPIIDFSATSLSGTQAATTLSNGLMFQDNFEDPDFTETSWNETSGTWVINDGKYYCDSTNSNCLSLVKNDDLVNYRISVDIQTVTGVDKQIFWGFVDGERHFGIDIRTAPYNDVVFTGQQLGGPFETYGSAKFQNDTGKWYHVVIETYSGKVRIYIDNILLIDYSGNNADVMKGSFGLGLFGPTIVYFDNFELIPMKIP